MKLKSLTKIAKSSTQTRKSSESMIYEQSTWENKPFYLLEFLNSIYEAVEIAFLNANQEQDLSQIILIGDSPANTENEVKSKRNNSEYAWKNSNKYRNPTYYKNEIKELKEKKNQGTHILC